MADVLSAAMHHLWKPQMVLGIHAWIRPVNPKYIGEQSIAAKWRTGRLDF